MTETCLSVLPHAVFQQQSTGLVKNSIISFLSYISSSNISRFSKLFLREDQEKICNDNIVSLHYLVKCRCRCFKATIQNKTSV